MSETVACCKWYCTGCGQIHCNGGKEIVIVLGESRAIRCKHCGGQLRKHHSELPPSTGEPCRPQPPPTCTFCKRKIRGQVFYRDRRPFCKASHGDEWHIEKVLEKRAEQHHV